MLLDFEQVTKLSDVPLGRRRLVATAGAALFGMAAKLAMPSVAHATPFCCVGGACGCCNGTTCCSQGCSAVSTSCSSGWQCWVCCYCGTNYQCCDWQPSGGGLCVCAAAVGGCGC